MTLQALRKHHQALVPNKVVQKSTFESHFRIHFRKTNNPVHDKLCDILSSKSYARSSGKHSMVDKQRKECTYGDFLEIEARKEIGVEKQNWKFLRKARLRLCLVVKIEIFRQKQGKGLPTFATPGYSRAAAESVRGPEDRWERRPRSMPGRGVAAGCQGNGWG